MTTTHSWKLKALHEMEPRKFYDFIGEVCFIKDEFNPLRTILYMTDYTENYLLPPHDGSEGRPKGKRTVIVTLWDSHSEDARNLQVSVGHIVYLKNLNSKIDRDGRLELVMHGPQSFGYRQINPVQVLDVNDDLAKGLRTRRSRYNADQIKEQRQLEAEQAGNSTIPLSISAVESSTIPPAAPASSGPSSLGPTTYMQHATSTAAESSMRSASPTIKNETRSPTPYASNKRQRITMESSKTPLHFSTLPTEASVPPTILLRDKLKDMVRRKKTKGDQYQRLYAHVVGFAPETIMDFSVPICHRCKFKSGPLSDKKVPSKCPHCHLSDTFKFEYGFMLRLQDDIGQEFDVHVDNAGAVSVMFQSSCSENTLCKN
ncbi:hypothetical protein BG011_007155 [Mortierella polycephala]|uniref:Protection of telomeres protein 1 ssDNA-binding domain-containing protein n=1 Tax=Mortierella polycephala TaxID=41804 RepID=A0A9P6QAH6_9FUNG|nr:hypothetical protein BG011_007155 [Mortierella polycephala]